jgi:hypothetical protein
MQTSHTIANYKPPTGLTDRLFLNPLSRLIHGNAAGYGNNTAARRLLGECQRQSAATLGPPPKNTLAAHLSREGYVALVPAYDHAILEDIRRRATACFEDPSQYVGVGRYALKPQRIVPHPERRVPQIGKLLTGEVSDIVTAYFRSHFTVEIIRLWRNYAVSAEHSQADHYSNLWHNDYDLAARLRFFVLLSDNVTPETGAMAVFPATHTKRVMRSGYVRRDAIYGRARALLEDTSQITFFTGNLGSAFFMNPQFCLHRASIPKEGSFRDIVQFTLVPSPAPMQDDWIDCMPDDPEIP